MKISKKGIYAIESMTDLAIYSADSVESIKNVAARRNLSEKYLEQIMGALRRANLIESTRGAAGGYRLAKPAIEITVLEILNATETNMVPVECLVGESECGIDCDKCATRTVWYDYWMQVIQVCQKITLQDIINQSKETKKASVEYFI